jgi:hypothetical protein
MTVSDIKRAPRPSRRTKSRQLAGKDKMSDER